MTRSAPGWRAICSVGLVLVGCKGKAEPTAFATSSSEPKPVAPTVPTGGAGPLDPSVLVVAYSNTGHTMTAGRELGEMLGARFVGVSVTPAEPTQPAKPAPWAGALGGVKTLYLGFPIWSEAPPDAVVAAVATATLGGVRVIPFYTYLHYADPAALARMATAIQARGGAPEPPLSVIVPPFVAEAGIVQRIQRALLGRPELWSTGEHAAASCKPGTPPERSPVCNVPAGAAWTGDDGSEASPPGYAPPRRRPVDAFAIDQREVTGADYGRCVAAGACKPVDLDTSYCKELSKGHPELPLPCVSFQDAHAYCTWTGGRLPTESEWARAARGESAVAFPWGATFPSGGELRGNFGEKPSTGDPHYATVPPDAAWPSDGHPGLAPACSFPAGKSPFGVCDLAGNLAEWVTVEGGPPRLMGGSWLDGEAAAFRVGSHADVLGGPGWYVSGFRCAR